MTCRIKDFSAIKSFFFSGRYCLQSIPHVIVSRGHELYIHFRARSKAKSNLTRRFKGNFLSHTTGTDMHYQNGVFFFFFFFSSDYHHHHHYQYHRNHFNLLPNSFCFLIIAPLFLLSM